MTRLELSEKIVQFASGTINANEMSDAVDAYTEALLKQCNGSGSLPPEIEDACVKFGVYVYAHNCNVDESGVAVELVKEDYQRYLAGRFLSVGT
jgi:hypothetical protein